MLEEPDAYIVLGPMRVDDIGLHQPDLVFGFPSPTAVAGFAHRLCLDVNRSMRSEIVRSLGAAVIVHDHSVHLGHSRNPPESQDELKKGARNVEDVKGRATVSIVVAVRVVADDEDELASRLGILVEEVRSLFPGLFFHGGKIFLSEGSYVVGIVRLVRPEDVETGLGALPGGFILADRRNLLEDHLEAHLGIDPLDGLLDIVESVPVGAETGHVEDDRSPSFKNFQRRYRGWLVPLFVGYQAIEAPVVRSTQRSVEPMPHVFAESLYSLGEFMSLRSLIRNGELSTLDGYLWRHSTVDESSTYYVSALGNI